MLFVYAKFDGDRFSLLGNTLKEISIQYQITQMKYGLDLVVSTNAVRFFLNQATLII